jgi:hypothetical protein
MNGAASPSGSGEVNGDVEALIALGDALERLGVTGALVLVQVAYLLRTYPRWAVWLPATDGEWTAVRPAGSRLPGPEMTMLWLKAETARELARMMRRADAQLSPGTAG